MKKMAKVLALALALCMVLSVSAFAETLSGEYGTSAANKETKTLTITVDVKNSASTEQIALLVVNKDLASVADATDSTIYFIDQQPAVAGQVRFTAPIAKDVDMVDIWVGSSTIAGSGAACKVGDDVVIKNLKGITISTGDAKKFYNIGAEITGATDAEGNAVVATRPVVAIKVNVKNVNILKMIWAIRNGNAVAYSNALELSAADYSSLDGDTWITGVFGTEQLKNLIGDGITDVDAIFLADDGAEYYTNAADEAGKKN
jgi:hypothetical protein